MVGNSDHIKGLVEVCLKLEAHCVRDSNHHSDLDAIPGAQARLLAADPNKAAAATLEASLAAKRTGDDQGGDDAKRSRPDAISIDWAITAPVASMANGFHVGHLVYDLRAMEKDAIKNGLIQQKFASDINLFGLVMRKLTGNDKRIAEVKKFAPSAKVHFDGAIDAWDQPVRDIFKNVNAASYKADTRAGPPGSSDNQRARKAVGGDGVAGARSLAPCSP